jgi:phosphoribosyl-ATP pyrophosphohydrolase
MSGDVLSRLAATISARRGATGEASYTKSLIERGRGVCARKFGEEAVEAIVAALSENPESLKAEAADVLYHLLVLLEAAEIPFDDVLMELERRMGQSGHEEKASRRTA